MKPVPCPHAARRAIRLLVPAVALGLLGACNAASYGSRLWDVELVTVPDGCDVWVVPNTRWVRERERILSEGVPALAAYDRMRTPCIVQRPPYVHVLVAAGPDAKLQWRTFTPSRDETVLIDLTPEPESPPPSPETTSTPEGATP